VLNAAETYNSVTDIFLWLYLIICCSELSVEPFLLDKIVCKQEETS